MMLIGAETNTPSLENHDELPPQNPNEEGQVEADVTSVNLPRRAQRLLQDGSRRSRSPGGVFVPRSSRSVSNAWEDQPQPTMLGNITFPMQEEIPVQHTMEISLRYSNCFWATVLCLTITASLAIVLEHTIRTEDTSFMIFYMLGLWIFVSVFACVHQRFCVYRGQPPLFPVPFFAPPESPEIRPIDVQKVMFECMDHMSYKDWQNRKAIETANKTNENDGGGTVYTSCVICLADFEPDDAISVWSSCQHLFCQECNPFYH